MSILDLYNKRENKKIFQNVGKSMNMQVPSNAYDTVIDKTEMIKRPISPNNVDNNFIQTSIIDLYNNGVYASVSSINSSQGLMQNYYNTYGYTSLIGDVTSYLMGLKDATHLVQSGLSSLIPGVTRSGIGTFALNTTNILLRSPFVSNIINNILPSPFSIYPDGVIKWQHLPSQMFLTTNPPNEFITTTDNGTDLLGIISNGVASIFASTVSGISNSGTLTMFDWERALGKGLNTAEIIMMAKSGLKYTKAVGWYDPTRPRWSGKTGYITYDRYIAYSNGELSYSRAKEKYNDTMIDRLNNNVQATSLASLASTPPPQTNVPIVDNFLPKDNSFLSNTLLSNSAAKVSAYKASLGQTTDPDKEPEKIYTNRPDIRENINRLGFPLYNRDESSKYNIDRGYIDEINMQDIIEDSYTYENALTRDLIDFRFEDISSKGRDNPVTLLFRATISGLSDDFSPNWNDIKYLGRPDSFHVYEGYSRKISFDMTIYCNSKKEVVPQWRKINRLAGMCYPISYSSGRVMKAPIMRLTIGNLYRRVYGFLDAFSITVNDDAMWDTELGYQLPHIITAKIGFVVMYENDNQGAPITDISHFNNSTGFPQLDGTTEAIFGSR